MPSLMDSTFAKYSLTEQETLAGSVLTMDQKLFIQNQIAMVAEEKLALVPDANNYCSFIQQEAEKAGQLHAYRYLLDCSLASETELLFRAQQAAGI